jgi:diguanylate cyclase (GGDEF)-like protein/PAS domain S-box-containing protein
MTSEHHLPEDASVYRTLLESTNAIPWKIDLATMTFAYIGPQIEQLLGWSQQSWVSANDWAERMHPEDREWVVNYCVSQSQSGVDHEADYRALTKSGEYVWIRDVVHVMRGEDGTPSAIIGFMFDISERKKTEQELERLKRELEELSYKDGLTGIANRRMFDSVFQVEWQNARRNRSPLSMIVVDIDHFKEYNDLYGHLKGDDCLKQVSAILASKAKRARDLLARFGGEEFIFILPETDAQSAQGIAQRCQHALQKVALPHAGSSMDPNVTISMGVGTIIPEAGDDPLMFLERVDTLLYQAKREGRNRICCG